MNCNCIEKIVADMLKLKQAENPSVTEVRFMNMTFDLTRDKQTYTNSEVNIVAGKRRIKTIYLNHNYCPFCGKPEEVKA